MKRKVIAIHGKMGSGKSTLSYNLRRILNKPGASFAHYSFALPIKQIATCAGFSDYWDSDQFPDKSDYSEILRAKFGESLQSIGMAFREMFGCDIWAKHFDNRIQQTPLVIVDDLRMQNELEYLKSKKGIDFDLFLIKIGDSPLLKDNVDDGRDKNHVTEKGLHDRNFDVLASYRPGDNEIRFILEKMKACGFLDSECAC